MRGLLIYAKEGDFDKLFVEENIITQLAQIIQNVTVNTLTLFSDSLVKP